MLLYSMSDRCLSHVGLSWVCVLLFLIMLFIDVSHAGALYVFADMFSIIVKYMS